jgi:hypothetical protein
MDIDMHKPCLYVFYDEKRCVNDFFLKYIVDDFVVADNIDEIRSHCKNEERKIKVIVFSFDFEDTVKKLKNIPLNPLDQIYDGEILLQTKKCPEKGKIDKIILTGSGTGTDDAGGLFSFDLVSNHHVCIMSGDFRQIKKTSTGYIALDKTRGIIQFDFDFAVKNVISFNNMNLHGFDICDSTGLLYLVETAKNNIAIYDLSKNEQIDEIQYGRNKDFDQYHINDILIDGKDIYLSMFSKNGVYHLDQWENDGTIVMIDKEKRYIKDFYMENLYAPHTIYKADGNIFVCDSMNHLLYCNGKIFGTFGGFTRGVYTDGYSLLLGQSGKRRIYENYSGTYHNVLNAGIYIYTFSGKCCNFLPINFTKNIYSIIAY